MQYLTSSQFVENEEITEIMDNKNLVQNLINDLACFKDGDYTIV
jgi:hypothetical protein